MSIIKDSAIKRKIEEAKRAEASKRNKPGVKSFDVKAFLENIKSKKQIRIFDVTDEQKQAEYEAQEAERKSKLSKYSGETKEGENDTYDLMITNRLLYKKFRILANILKDKGLLGDLVIRGGMVLPASDKVQEILEKLADKMDDPNISDAAFEKEAIILATDIDDRAERSYDDLNRNGIDDDLEDPRYVMSIEAARKAYEEEKAEDDRRQHEDREYQRQCREKAEENQKEEEELNKLHGRDRDSILGIIGTTITE